MSVDLKELPILDPNPIIEEETYVGKISVYLADSLFVPAAYQGALFLAVSDEHRRPTYGYTARGALNHLFCQIKYKKVDQ